MLQACKLVGVTGETGIDKWYMDKMELDKMVIILCVDLNSIE